MTVRFGAVVKNRTSYGAVRCDFQKSRHLTVRISEIRIISVRFCAFFRYRKSSGAGRCRFHKAEILRCGSARLPVERLLLGCGSTPRRKILATPLFIYGAPEEEIVKKTRFPTILTLFSGHGMNKPYKPAGSTVFFTRFVFFPTFYAKPTATVDVAKKRCQAVL